MHKEHQSNTRLRDVILGGQDGLVNVLGVVLGVSAATSDLRLIIISGLAATFAESISMAAVAFTSTEAEKDQLQKAQQEEKYEVENTPQAESEEVKSIFSSWGFQGSLLDQAVSQITSNKEIWTKFMMKEELGTTATQSENPFKAAVVVGFASLIGSLIPLVPFFLLNQVNFATVTSIVTCGIVLFLTGAVKAKLTVGNFYKEGFKLLFIGISSALAGYVIGHLLGSASF